MKIVINNPCHESWASMTPNNKGAFCLSCRKNVIDFSKKTVEEIKGFFNELPENKSVCGRFREEQLNEINFGHFFMQFRRWRYFQKAAVIAFFIFGFSLFGHAQDDVSKYRDMLKGEVAVAMPSNSAKIEPEKKNIARPINADPVIMGGPGYIRDHDKKPRKPLPKNTPVITDPENEK